jgi:hypothetical protein
MMPSIVRDDRLVAITVVVVALLGLIALLGWTTFFYSAHSSATRDRERHEALAQITSERDALLSGQQRMGLEQERLQRELALANAQLAAAREQIASLEPQKAAKKAEGGGVEPVDPPRKTAQKRPPPARL